jgi:hypothetical protein
MKKQISLTFAVSFLFFTVNLMAQTLTCTKPDGDEFDPKAETVLVLLKSKSPEVTKVRIVPQKNDLISWQDVTPNKTVALNLKLEKGENTFDIVGFNSEREPIQGQSCVVSVRRPSAVANNTNTNSNTNSRTSGNTNSNTNQNNLAAADTKPNTNASPTPEPKTQSKHFRASVGLEVVGASSSPSEQQPFFDLFFSTPIGSQYPGVKGWKRHLQFSVWGNTRFSSSPVQNISSLSNFTLPTFANNFVGTASQTKFNELVKSFEFRAGGELQIFKSYKPYGGLLPGVSSVSLIMSAGAVTPLSFENGSVFYEVPKVNNGADVDPRFKELFPGVTTQKIIAFTTPERERFYRQYFAGFRIKTHYLKTDSNSIYSEESLEREDLVPGMFDITFGQNEAITNKLRGVILRLDGSMPIPITNNILYVFGSAQMRLGKNIDKPLPGIFLKPSLGIDLSSADVFVVPANQNPLFRSNRDTFRIGVGVDLLKLFNKSNDNQSNSDNQSQANDDKTKEKSNEKTKKQN